MDRRGETIQEGKGRGKLSRYSVAEKERWGGAGGEKSLSPALGSHGQLVKRSEGGRLADPANHVGLVFQNTRLGGDETESHNLVTLGEAGEERGGRQTLLEPTFGRRGNYAQAERLEPTRAGIVVLEKVHVNIELLKKDLRNRLVACGHQGTLSHDPFRRQELRRRSPKPPTHRNRLDIREKRDVPPDAKWRDRKFPLKPRETVKNFASQDLRDTERTCRGGWQPSCWPACPSEPS